MGRYKITLFFLLVLIGLALPGAGLAVGDREAEEKALFRTRPRQDHTPNVDDHPPIHRHQVTLMPAFCSAVCERAANSLIQANELFQNIVLGMIVYFVVPDDKKN